MKPVYVRFENDSCIIQLSRPWKSGDEEYVAQTASSRIHTTCDGDMFYCTTLKLRSEEAAKALLVELTEALEDLKARREAYLMDSTFYAA